MQLMMLKSETNHFQEWIPFVTQQVFTIFYIQFFFFLISVFNFQQRLRNLIQIFGYNLCAADSDLSTNRTSFYYTLHLTTMCAPFYTSERVCNRNPKWAKIDVCSSIGSAKSKSII